MFYVSVMFGKQNDFYSKHGGPGTPGFAKCTRLLQTVHYQLLRWGLVKRLWAVCSFVWLIDFWPNKQAGLRNRPVWELALWAYGGVQWIGQFREGFSWWWRYERARADVVNKITSQRLELKILFISSEIARSRMQWHIICTWWNSSTKTRDVDVISQMFPARQVVK